MTCAIRSNSKKFTPQQQTRASHRGRPQVTLGGKGKTEHKGQVKKHIMGHIYDSPPFQKSRSMTSSHFCKGKWISTSEKRTCSYLSQKVDCFCDQSVMVFACMYSTLGQRKLREDRQTGRLISDRKTRRHFSFLWSPSK